MVLGIIQEFRFQPLASATPVADTSGPDDEEAFQESPGYIGGEVVGNLVGKLLGKLLHIEATCDNRDSINDGCDPALQSRPSFVVSSICPYDHIGNWGWLAGRKASFRFA